MVQRLCEGPLQASISAEQAGHPWTSARPSVPWGRGGHAGPQGHLLHTEPCLCQQEWWENEVPGRTAGKRGPGSPTWAASWLVGLRDFPLHLGGTWLLVRDSLMFWFPRGVDHTARQQPGFSPLPPTAGGGQEERESAASGAGVACGRAWPGQAAVAHGPPPGPGMWAGSPRAAPAPQSFPEAPKERRARGLRFPDSSC